ncbi:MAG: MopE-related protein [Myxococcota bacterium]|nr:MopE-related protein [Myxococcota bacterium]
MKNSALILTLAALLAGCGDKDPIDTGSPYVPPDDSSECDTGDDADCDGYPDDQDCDPYDPYTNPGMDEIPYDGRDNDCAGDGDLNDVDGDGYIGTSAGGDDCNDGNPDAHPDAIEECYDAVDDDCDGVAQGYETNDCDEDGYVDRGDEADDCDPEDPEINPGAEEVWYDGIDSDCDGESDYDADQDGDTSSEYGGPDCDDTDPEVNGANPELWDAEDNNCDTVVDDLEIEDAWLALKANSSSGDGLFGWSLDTIDDIDKDGNIELVIGAPTSGDSDNGWAHIISVGEGDGVPSELALATVEGNDFAQLGWDLASVGDLDGDGAIDVLIGAPGESTAWLISGSDLAGGGAVSTDDALSFITGTDGLGYDISALGDIDADGFQEVVAGSSGFLSKTGTWVGVWDGEDLGAGSLTTSSALFTVYGEEIGGESVGGADYDADGIADLVVATAVDDVGAVTLLLGADIALGGDYSINDLPALTGESGVRGAVHNGWVPDMDGDGYDELVFSMPDADSSDGIAGAGIVYVVDGDDASASSGDISAVASAIIEGEEDYGALTSIDIGGDFDGDALGDLIVSDVGDSDGTVISVTYAFYGADLGSGSHLTSAFSASFTAGDTQDYTGYAGVAADIDGDGDDDLALGAPYGGVRVGYVYAYQSLLFAK